MNTLESYEGIVWIFHACDSCFPRTGSIYSIYSMSEGTHNVRIPLNNHVTSPFE